MGNDSQLEGFISYAHKNLVWAEEFIGLYRDRAVTHRGLTITAWWDAELPVGKEWFNELHDRMHAAAAGIMLCSHEFFASEFIKTYEVSHFVGNNKPVFPAMLGPYRIETTEAHKLDGLQVYRYRPPGTATLLSFAQCDGVQKGMFVNGFVDAIAGELGR